MKGLQNPLVLISAIGVIGLLETVALLKGVDGLLLTLAIGAIAAIAGAKIRDLLPRGGSFTLRR